MACPESTSNSSCCLLAHTRSGPEPCLYTAFFSVGLIPTGNRLAEVRQVRVNGPLRIPQLCSYLLHRMRLLRRICQSLLQRLTHLLQGEDVTGLRVFDFFGTGEAGATVVPPSWIKSKSTSET